MKYYSEESIRLWQRDFDSSLDDYPCIEIKEPHEMRWRTDRPKKIGNYIVIIPEIVHIIGFQDMEKLPQKVNGAVREAWFNGKNFELTHCGSPKILEIGQCVWTPEPLILCGKDGLTVFEVSEERKK